MLGVSKSTVSLHLNEIERRTGLQVIPRNPAPPPPGRHRGDVSAGRQMGVKRASIRDFHSFRVTWITLALLSTLTASRDLPWITRKFAVRYHSALDNRIWSMTSYLGSLSMINDQPRGRKRRTE